MAKAYVSGRPMPTCGLPMLKAQACRALQIASTGLLLAVSRQAGLGSHLSVKLAT